MWSRYSSGRCVTLAAWEQHPYRRVLPRGVQRRVLIGSCRCHLNNEWRVNIQPSFADEHHQCHALFACPAHSVTLPSHYRLFLRLQSVMTRQYETAENEHAERAPGGLPQFLEWPRPLPLPVEARLNGGTPSIWFHIAPRGTKKNR